MINQVEELRPELKSNRLTDQEILEYREINGDVTRTSHRVSANVAELTVCRICKCRGVEPLLPGASPGGSYPRPPVPHWAEHHHPSLRNPFGHGS